MLGAQDLQYRDLGLGNHLLGMSLIWACTGDGLLLWLKSEALLSVTSSYCTTRACPVCCCVGAMWQTSLLLQGQWRHPPLNALELPFHSILKKTSDPCPGNSMPVYHHRTSILGHFALILVLNSAERQ